MNRTSMLLLLATAASVPAYHVHAADSPQMKPGLWEVASTFDGGGRRRAEPITMTVQHCVGEKMETGLWDPSRAPGMQNCAPPRHSRQGNAYVLETDCKQGETKVKARVTTTASSDRFESDMQFTYDPPRKGRSTGSMKLVGKFLGACPADLKPGAVRMTGMPVPGAVPPTAK